MRPKDECVFRDKEKWDLGSNGAFSHPCRHKKNSCASFGIPLSKGLWEVCVVLPAAGDATVVESIVGSSGT